MRALKPPHSTTGQGLLCYISVFQELPRTSPLADFRQILCSLLLALSCSSFTQILWSRARGDSADSPMARTTSPFGQTLCECPAV
jgi:hypothetical protein